MGILASSGVANQLSVVSKWANSLENTEKTPLFFFGHGSPMNAIEQNQFTKKWNELGKKITKPRAILCISAHWETSGTYVTAMDAPKTIHDFGGFPPELYQVNYPAPGNPELAHKITETMKSVPVKSNIHWGLDHGCWSVVKHLYPEADVPVLQLSIDYTKPPQYHYNLAKELAFLRQKGVLIIGSGNIVHNLRMVAWDKITQPNFAYDWAQEANDKMLNYINDNDFQPLIDYHKQGKAFQLAIPTPEHFLPLLYVLALKGNKESSEIFNNEAVMGSLTMTSVMIS